MGKLNPIKILGIAVIILIFLSALMTLRTCSLSKKAIELKTQYEQKSKEVEKEAVVHLKTIDEMSAQIKQKDTHIAEISKKIEKTNVALKYRDQSLSQLESSYKTLGNDKDAKIGNLESQVAIWKEKFSLAESIITDKDAIIFDLTQKYESQVKISLSYKSMYEGELGLKELALKRISVLESGIGSLQFGGKVKTAIIAIIGGYLIYELVK